MERLEHSPVRIPVRGWSLRRGRLALRCGLVLGLGLTGPRLEAAAAAAEESGAAVPAAGIPEDGASDWTANVSLLEEYRLRRASGALAKTSPLGEAAADDQLDQRLRLHSDVQVDGADEHFRGVFSGALWWNVDGAQESGHPVLFASQYDESALWVAPYALSAEWHDAGVLDHVRVGRQDTEHGLPLTFDGASLGLRPMGRFLLLYGFGGQTVHFFETMPGLLENWVASTGAVLRPIPALQVELDARLVREQRNDSMDADGSAFATHSYGLTAWTRTDLIAAKLQVRGLNEEVSHAAGSMSFSLPSAGFGLDAQVSGQFVTLDEVAESENPYFALLGPSLPHARYRFEAWKEFGLGGEAIWTNHLGWRGRQLLDGEEQPFNRNAGALYLDSRVDDLIERGLSFGASAEYNYVPTSPDEGWLFTLGGCASYDSGTFRTEVGTYYQRFKINYYQRAEELNDARTVYGSVGYRAAEWLELRGRYELEIVDRYLESFSISARQDF